MSVYTTYGNGVSTDFAVPMARTVSALTVAGSATAFTQPLGPHMVRVASAPAAGAAVVIDFADPPTDDGSGGGGGGPTTVTNPASSPVLVQQYDEANPLAPGALNIATTFTRTNNTVDATKTITLTKAGASRTLTYNSAGELLGVSVWS